MATIENGSPHYVNGFGNSFITSTPIRPTKTKEIMMTTPGAGKKSTGTGQGDSIKNDATFQKDLTIAFDVIHRMKEEQDVTRHAFQQVHTFNDRHSSP